MTRSKKRITKLGSVHLGEKFIFGTAEIFGEEPLELTFTATGHAA
jgi:hypothetical protein